MTERTLGVKRTFFLGQFKNIVFEDIISNLPEKVWRNQKVLDLLTSLQLISVEISFRKYQSLVGHMREMSLEDSLVYLEQLRGDTIDSIKEVLNGDTVDQQEDT